MTDTPAADALDEIRERGYRNGATGAECARLSDAAAVDVPRLLKAVDAALNLADDWAASEGTPALTARGLTAQAFRSAITWALTASEGT